MTRLTRAFIRDESGATAVEFVLVLPILLTMIFGIICFGQYFAIANSLQQLAAEAARSSAMGIARFTFLGPDKVVETITMLSASEPHGIEVSLSYDLQGSAVDLAGGFVGFDVSTLTRSSYLAY